MKATSRAALARVNEYQPHDLYRDFFFSLLNRCQLSAQKNRFKFDGKIYRLDATVIDLCLSIFPLATFRKTNETIKLHFGLNTDGYLAVFMDMTNGRVHESTWAKALSLPSGSTVVFDRGFNDYAWYQALTDHHIVLVTRLKSNAVFDLLDKHQRREGQGIYGDRRIRLKNMDADLRIVDFKDMDTGKIYRFLTNAFSLKANIIADLYKERWNIELFFKWIKQNLRVKTFLGSSPNAVLTQLSIALCVYLSLALLKFKAKLGISLTAILRLLQLHIFARRDLWLNSSNRQKDANRLYLPSFCCGQYYKTAVKRFPSAA